MHKAKKLNSSKHIWSLWIPCFVPNPWSLGQILGEASQGRASMEKLDFFTLSLPCFAPTLQFLDGHSIPEPQTGMKIRDQAVLDPEILHEFSGIPTCNSWVIPEPQTGIKIRDQADPDLNNSRNSVGSPQAQWSVENSSFPEQFKAFSGSIPVFCPIFPGSGHTNSYLHSELRCWNPILCRFHPNFSSHNDCSLFLLQFDILPSKNSLWLTPVWQFLLLLHLGAHFMPPLFIPAIFIPPDSTLNSLCFVSHAQFCSNLTHFFFCFHGNLRGKMLSHKINPN